MSEREPPRPPTKAVRATIVDAGWTSAPPPLADPSARPVPKRALPPLPEPTNSPLAGVLPDLPDAPFPPLSDPDLNARVGSDDDNDGDIVSSIPPARPLPTYDEQREPIVTQVDDEIQSRILAMRDSSKPEMAGARVPSVPPPPPSARMAAAPAEKSSPKASPDPVSAPRAAPAPSASRAAPPPKPNKPAAAAQPGRSQTVMFGQRLPVPPGAPAPPPAFEPASEPFTQPLATPAPAPVVQPAPIVTPFSVGTAPTEPVAPLPFAAAASAPLAPQSSAFDSPALPSDSTAPTPLAAITQRVRFAGGEIPLWSLVSPAVLLIALAAAFIGAAVAGPSESEGTESTDAAASASGASPLPLSTSPAEERKNLGKLERAALGDEALLKEIEAKPSNEQSFEEALALAQGMGAREVRRARELREKLARDPALAKDQKIGAELRRYVENPQTAPEALAAMARLPGPLGADMLYEVWTGTVSKNAATELARTLVLSKDVQSKASPALKAALDLRAAEECDAAKGVLSQATEHGDRRSLALLTKLNRKFGCGPNKRQDCYPCLREGEELKRAIEAVKARREPKLFGR